MKRKIILDLHKDDHALILESQDVYKYVGENNEQELELAFYIGKWCEYLNYYIFNNKEMSFGDSDYARLEGWLTGYNHAKKIQVNDFKDRVEINTKGYFIILSKPFEI